MVRSLGVQEFNEVYKLISSCPARWNYSASYNRDTTTVAARVGKFLGEMKNISSPTGCVCTPELNRDATKHVNGQTDSTHDNTFTAAPMPFKGHKAKNTKLVWRAF